MSKFVFVQNIFAPYRIFLFNLLHEKGLNMEVFYQSETENGRSWKIDHSELKHPYWVDKKSIYFQIRKYHIHINPRMFIRILRLSKNTNVQLAGWDNIDTFILCTLKKLGLIRKKFSISCEANYLSQEGLVPNKGFRNWIRKYVMSSIDGFTIIPGKMPILALKHFGVDINKLNFALLPNMIEEYKVFPIEGIKEEHQLPIFIIPARLIEYYKGILNFFKSIGNENIRKAIFWIAGDGEDQELYEKFIFENKLSEHIQLLGFKNMDEMNILYNKADAMLLPSFYDASPLSLIEATRVGLPILCSNHCGNHFECVVPGHNGEIFDPCDMEQVKRVFEKFLSDRSKWKQYSDRSLSIYKETLCVDQILSVFMKQIS